MRTVGRVEFVWVSAISVAVGLVAGWALWHVPEEQRVLGKAASAGLAVVDLFERAERDGALLGVKIDDKYRDVLTKTEFDAVLSRIESARADASDANGEAVRGEMSDDDLRMASVYEHALRLYDGAIDQLKRYPRKYSRLMDAVAAH